MTQGPPPSPPQAPPSPPSSRPQTISLCMILKNEERRLPTLLKSAAPWVDEIIVVDTGSTDRTVEIAESFGAKVYHHPWEHNFSKHRNQSISYATGDWILILDADEELDQATAPLIRRLTAAPEGLNGFLFELYNDISAGGESFILHPRMFRNRVGFHYQGLVHNRPMVPGRVAPAKVKLIHYGYNESPEVMEAKHQRRLEMIRKWVESEPDNYRARSYLAHTLLARPATVGECVEVAQETLAMAREQRAEVQDFPHIYYPLLNGLTVLGRDEELLRHAKDCQALTPFYPDPAFFENVVHFRNQRWPEAVEAARRFIELQDSAREHPERFIFVENLTYDQLPHAVTRWVLAAAHLGRDEEAKEAFERLFNERNPQTNTRQTIFGVLQMGAAPLARALAQRAAELHPQWDWVPEVMEMTRVQNLSYSTKDLLVQGKKALEQGRLDEAVEILKTAIDLTPLDAESIMHLAQALDQRGDRDLAEAWLMRGLNLFPGQPLAWRRVADANFERGNWAGAAACYRRAQSMIAQEDPVVAQRLAKCDAETAATPSVAQKPPRLLVFLVNGLSPEMALQPAPHYMMGRAWGRIGSADDPGLDYPAWATLFTGVSPEVHGLTREPTRQEPASFKDLKVTTLWELLPQGMRLGLAGVPLAHPSPRLPGWSLAGWPGGLLGVDTVHPGELAPMALAAGYRSDYCLTPVQDESFAQDLEQDIRKVAFLFQVDRNRLAAALALPAVDVLVVGLNSLDYMQRTKDLASRDVFFAYQQLYAMIESCLAALGQPQFAVLSQRSYSLQGGRPLGQGYYCLSWRRGEQGQVRATHVAPELLQHLGGDLGALGRPRS